MHDDAPPTPSSGSTRLSSSAGVAAIGALAGVTLPQVHAASGGELHVALIGCGGRGTGAAANAITTQGGPVKLIAMADVFENRLSRSYQTLKPRHPDAVDVPPERQFLGFDAYQKAMDCLKPGDIAIFTTPLAFRWVHFGYAIQKGLNVFMEKPLTADGPTSKRMLALADQAAAKNLKVGVGLMSRHSRPLQELHQRIADGELGELVLLRGYRMQGGGGSVTRWPGQPSELLWQIRHFHSFLWASGGAFSDFYIHIIDHLCWMKNAWPIKAQALGSRHYRYGPEGDLRVDQNFDAYAVEYIFPDGARMLMDGRGIVGCNDLYSSYVHGTKGSAIVSRNGDCGAPSAIFKGQTPRHSDMVWNSTTPPGQQDPYENEWNELVQAIRNDQPYNEARRGIEASLVTSMGRMAAHTGQEITYEDMLNSEHQFAADVDKLTFDSPAPLPADKEGKYPVPMPGMTGKREY